LKDCETTNVQRVNSNVHVQGSKQANLWSSLQADQADAGDGSGEGSQPDKGSAVFYAQQGCKQHSG
jgi:hypothetical protein